MTPPQGASGGPWGIIFTATVNDLFALGKVLFRAAKHLNSIHHPLSGPKAKSSKVPAKTGMRKIRIADENWKRERKRKKNARKRKNEINNIFRQIGSTVSRRNRKISGGEREK